MPLVVHVIESAVRTHVIIIRLVANRLRHCKPKTTLENFMESTVRTHILITRLAANRLGL
jgi:hypothetical protein